MKLFFSVFFISLLFVLPPINSWASDEEAYQVRLPSDIKFGSSVEEVREKCHDIQTWDSENYASVYCANKFSLKKYVQNKYKMSFKFDKSLKELVKVEFYEQHPNAFSHNRRVMYFLRKYGKKYGEPVKKHCGYKHGKDHYKCIQHFWEVGKTQLMMHIAREPNGKFYGIYFVWSQNN